MPTAPLRYCTMPGCSAKVTARRCAAHYREPWTSEQPRVRGRRLQRLRAQLFRRQPLCVVCEADGRVTLAAIRDHIIPFAEGGQDDEANVQALCHACSDAKTAREAARGAARAR